MAFCIAAFTTIDQSRFYTGRTRLWNRATCAAKAAENVHLAQPLLTRQIKDLEAEIGVRLFDRSRKRISLTQEGE
jgi:hypothetical protein